MLKVASRFEILVNQRKGMEEFKDMNTMEILQSIAGRYNQYKANAALKKWQLSPEFVNAIAGIIFITSFANWALYVLSVEGPQYWLRDTLTNT